MASDVLISGVWHDATLEPFGLVHHLQYRSLVKHTLIMSIFNYRGAARAELDQHPSYYRQVMHYPEITHATAQELHTDYFSVVHIQENHYSFKCFIAAFDGYVDYVDLVLGPYAPEAVATCYNNYFKMPLYARLLYQQYGVPTLEQIQAELDKIQQARMHVWQRSAVAALIARHDSFNRMPGVRRQLVAIANQVFTEPVRCAGALLHNDDSLKAEFADNKLVYLQQFIFNICPENSYAPGYVTEKLWHACQAGCIPIYWGGIAPEADIFNLQAILLYQPRHPEQLVARLQELATSADARLALLQQPVFHAGAAARIFLRYFYPVLKHLHDTTSQDLYLLRKHPTSSTSLAEQYHQAIAMLEAIGITEDTYLYQTLPEYRWPFLARERQVLQ